jgi:hypothetical protein
MNVFMPVCPSAWNNSASTGWILIKFGIWRFFIKLWRQLKFHWNLTLITVLYMKTHKHLWWYLAEFSLEWEMFQTKVVQKIKTHIVCSIFFSRKSCRLWDSVEKHFRYGQATDDNMTHVHCMLDTSGYTYTPTHTEYVILIAFPQQTMVERTPLNVTLHVHCLSC